MRAGYGISTIPFPDNFYAFNFPVKQTNDFNAPNTFAPAPVRMADGFPAPIVANVPSNGIIPADTALLRSQRYFAVPTDLHEGRLQSWNVAYQRQLLYGFTAEAAYVGNRGNIVNQINLNAGMVPGLDNAGRPQFVQGGRTAETTGFMRSNTTYHSLQTKFDKRFSRGLLITTSYTLGRSINYWQGDSNGGITRPRTSSSAAVGPSMTGCTVTCRVSSTSYRSDATAVGCALGRPVGFSVAGKCQESSPRSWVCRLISLRAPRRFEPPATRSVRTPRARPKFSAALGRRVTGSIRRSSRRRHPIHLGT